MSTRGACARKRRKYQSASLRSARAPAAPASFAAQGPAAATSRMSRCDGSSRLSGVCTASEPPAASLLISAGSSVSWPGIHWITALARMTSNPVSAQPADVGDLEGDVRQALARRARSCRANCRRRRSEPQGSARAGLRSNCPGRSRCRRRARRRYWGCAATRSRTGLVRSSSNLTYWAADQDIESSRRHRSLARGAAGRGRSLFTPLFRSTPQARLSLAALRRKANMAC